MFRGVAFDWQVGGSNTAPDVTWSGSLAHCPPPLTIRPAYIGVRLKTLKPNLSPDYVQMRPKQKHLERFEVSLHQRIWSCSRVHPPKTAPLFLCWGTLMWTGPILAWRCEPDLRLVESGRIQIWCDWCQSAIRAQRTTQNLIQTVTAWSSSWQIMDQVQILLTTLCTM